MYATRWFGCPTSWGWPRLKPQCHSMDDRERLRKSTKTDAWENSRLHTSRLSSVVAGPSGAPSGLVYSGYHALGIPHSTCNTVFTSRQFKWYCHGGGIGW